MKEMEDDWTTPVRFAICQEELIFTLEKFQPSSNLLHSTSDHLQLNIQFEPV